MADRFLVRSGRGIPFVGDNLLRGIADPDHDPLLQSEEILAVIGGLPSNHLLPSSLRDHHHDRFRLQHPTREQQGRDHHGPAGILCLPDHLPYSVHSIRHRLQLQPGDAERIRNLLAGFLHLLDVYLRANPQILLPLLQESVPQLDQKG